MWHGLLLSASIFHAQGQDPFCEDEQAFLQARSTPRSPPLANRADPSSLLSTVRNLAHIAKQESPEAVTALVSTIHDTLQEMKVPLRTEHSASQQQLDDQFAEIRACGESSSYGTDADRQVLLDCRDRLQSARDAKSSACDLFDEQSTVLQNEDRTRHDASGQLITPPVVSWPNALNRQADSAMLLAHMQDWKRFLDAELTDLTAKSDACAQATTHLTAEEEECAHQQSVLDDAMCSHWQSCELLQACHTHEKDAYDSLKGVNQRMETARQDQFRSISQIECLLGFTTTALQNNATIEDADLDTCDGDVAVDHLVLNLHTEETLTDCPDIPDTLECPALQLPEAWSNGEAAPAPPAAVDLPAGEWLTSAPALSRSTWHAGIESIECGSPEGPSRVPASQRARSWTYLNFEQCNANKGCGYDGFSSTKLYMGETPWVMDGFRYDFQGFYHQAQKVSSFRIEYSNDDIEWTQVFQTSNPNEFVVGHCDGCNNLDENGAWSGTHCDAGCEFVDVEWTGVAAKYWRWVLEAHRCSTVASIAWKGAPVPDPDGGPANGD